MWLDDIPDPSEKLRQGDLIVGSLLPQLKLPMSYARFPGKEPSQENSILLPVFKAREYLVVSQCCTIENYNVAALAPIEATGKLPDDRIAAHKALEPGSGVGYVIAAHYVPPVRDHLNYNGPGVMVANFRRIQTFSGDLQSLQDSRVAMMTPEGRRILRIRLGLFWSRPEAEDQKWFDQEGLPSGLAPVAVAGAEEGTAVL